jgi:hypothetical protein
MTAESTSGPSTPKVGWHEPLPATLPRPTAMPAIVALGASFIAWGVVTSWIISGVGLVMFSMGIAGWIWEMRLEHERREHDSVR